MKCITLMSVIVLALFTIPTYAGDNEKDDPSFVVHEYWQCAPENISALQEASETIWGPIFDDLVAEGKFLGWGKLMPTGTVKYASAGEATPEEIEPDHQWFAWFESASAEANEAAWAEFGERLRALNPDDPRPWLFCDALTNVTYKNYGSQPFAPPIAGCTSFAVRTSALGRADNDGQDSVTTIEVDAAKDFVARHKNAVIVDVRTPVEYEMSHITGAVNVSVQVESFEDMVIALDPNKTYIVHCTKNPAGGRCSRALGTLQSLGFKHLYSLEGGYVAWQDA